MNNGNLLNSLLGITSANPAATKASAAKARAESTEKFQQALEQARPDIAARKPAARKENPPAEPSSASRPAPKPAAQQHSQHETNRMDAPVKARTNAQDVANNAVEKSESSVRDADIDETVSDTQNKEQYADSRDQTLAGETQKTEAEAAEQFAAEAQIAIDTSLIVGPALVVAGESAIESPESLLNLVNGESLGLGDLAGNGDTDSPEVYTEAAVVDPSLMVTQPVLVSAAPELSGASTLSTDDVELSLSPLSAGYQPALSQVVPGPAPAGSAADAQSLAIQAASGTLVGTLAVDESVNTEDAETGALVGADTDSGENPDFLLLNSKAALNKVAEATIATATLDKAAAVVDAAKPATVSAAVETLTRLTEAQSPAARAFVVQTGVPVTVGTPQWSQAVGDKVLWLAAQNVSSAEIRLDPPELGPLQVKVSVNQDQASISFTSPHPAVREALDQQLNRLRDMFSEQGLNLVNVDVSDKSFAQREREQKESAKHQGHTEADDDELMPVGVTQAISMRLVDHYA